MEANALHDLTAAYALDALDADDARAYEEHLARCERCRDELATLSDTAGELAYATDAPSPPARLRARILEEAARDRENVVPLRPRWLMPVAAAAAVAACAAIGLGIWAATLSNKLDSRNEALTRQQRVTQVLASPDARRVEYARGTLAVVVGKNGDAALLLRDLDAPASGRTYEAWVADGGDPQPAGLFGGGKVVAVPLDVRVRDGATIMLTEEPAGGRATPSGKPFLVAPYPPASS